MANKFLKNSLTARKLTLITRNWILDDENKPILSYLHKGYFKDVNDLYDLHRSFSPYKVLDGLTGLQVRRRINAFRKNGSVLKNPYENACRVNITVDGKSICGTTYGKPVSNHDELVVFLKDLLKVLKAPKVAIKDNL